MDGRLQTPVFCSGLPVPEGRCRPSSPEHIAPHPVTPSPAGTSRAPNPWPRDPPAAISRRRRGRPHLPPAPPPPAAAARAPISAWPGAARARPPRPPFPPPLPPSALSHSRARAITRCDVSGGARAPRGAAASGGGGGAAPLGGSGGDPAGKG